MKKALMELVCWWPEALNTGHGFEQENRFLTEHSEAFPVFLAQGVCVWRTHANKQT